MRLLNVIDRRDTHEIGESGKTIFETDRVVDHHSKAIFNQWRYSAP